MSEQEKCPNCESVEIARTEDSVRFDCMTICRDGEVVQVGGWCQNRQVTRLAARVKELEAENSKLKTIANSLPKTADGVPCYPGMKVYDAQGRRFTVSNGAATQQKASSVYSTRQAAAAAQDHKEQEQSK